MRGPRHARQRPPRRAVGLFIPEGEGSVFYILSIYSLHIAHTIPDLSLPPLTRTYPLASPDLRLSPWTQLLAPIGPYGIGGLWASLAGLVVAGAVWVVLTAYTRRMDVDATAQAPALGALVARFPSYKHLAAAHGRAVTGDVALSAPFSPVYPASTPAAGRGSGRTPMTTPVAAAMHRAGVPTNGLPYVPRLPVSASAAASTASAAAAAASGVRGVGANDYPQSHVPYGTRAPVGMPKPVVPGSALNISVTSPLARNS